MVYQGEQPDWHPIHKRWAHQGRSVFGEQDELERGRFQPRLLAVVEVARGVAEGVDIHDEAGIIDRVQPDGEDERLFG